MQQQESEMYVVYDISSTMQVGPLPRSGKPHTLYAKIYKTAHMAARACRRFNDGRACAAVHDCGEYGWCTAEHYRTRVVRTVERVNMMSGKRYLEPSNTPGFMSPSSEAYWSM